MNSEVMNDEPAYLPGEAYDHKEIINEAGFDTTRMVRDTIAALKRFEK